MNKILTARIIKTLIVTLSLCFAAAACASIEQSDDVGMRGPATKGESCKELNADGTCKVQPGAKNSIETMSNDRSSRL